MRSFRFARSVPAWLPATALLIAACGGQKVDTTANRPSAAGNCTDCHGSAAGGTSAPPRTSYGATATTDPGVGAHEAHIRPSLLHRAMACAECHPTPETVGAPHHNDGTVDVVFGGLARAGDRTGPPAIPEPAWNKVATATSPALSCSATYCHGGTLHDGTNRTPIWTEVGTRQAACGTCHAVPPTWSGHPDITAVQGYDPQAPQASCIQCHPGTVKADGTIDVATGQHIDGILQIGAKACTQCHGDAARTPVEVAPAPPGQGRGFTFSEGAHLAHLTGRRWAATPVACSECHPSHGSMVGHPAGTAAARVPAQVTWGPLASAGGSVPALLRGGAAPTCATTYCHGATLAGGTNEVTPPAWNGGPSAADCRTCHGVPPPMAPAGPHPDITGEPGYSIGTPERACYNCHPGTVNDQGQLLALDGFHMNGYVDLFTDGGTPPVPRTCTTCHGNAAAPVVIHAAPPKAVGGATDPAERGVGAHQAHLKDGTLSLAITCSQCHPTVTNTDHAAVGAAVSNHSVEVAFGPLATNLGTSWPTWDAQPRYDGAGNRVGCGPNGADCTCSAVYCHGDGLSGGTNPKPRWTGGAGEVAACDSCHGVPPPSPHVARLDCGTCHAGYTNSTVNLAAHANGVLDASTLACTVCHGDSTRTPATAAAAPPFDLAGGTLTSSRGVGAHQRHLIDGLLRRAMPCTECHQVPTTMNHSDGAVDVAFGTLARADGALPAWNATATATAPALSCSATYCHGATMGGGTGKTPVWTKVDGSYTTCGNCHGIPPPTPHVNSPLCGGCHPGYTSTTVNLATHINGTVQTNTACTNCHGTAGRSPTVNAPAPPSDLHKGTATTLRGVGAHQAHLAATIGKPVACTECHTVPANVNNHPNNALDVTFGPLSRSNGSTPAWNGTGPTPALTCSASYCHGSAAWGGTAPTPIWTKVDGTYLACNACHGIPPPATAPTSHPSSNGTDCGSCHTGYSATTVVAATHIDGVIQATGASCTSCHGDSANPVAAAAAAPPLALATSGTDRTSISVRGVGAHQAHLVGSANARAMACSECHPVPATVSSPGHNTNPSVVNVVFGPLASTGGLVPSWNGSGTTPALTCSATYCHGTAAWGGQNLTPKWTVSGPLACDACHGIPPPTTAPNNHPSSNGSDCAGCHTGYTATSVNLTLHIDGKIDASGGSCTSCHGDANRTPLTGADAQVKSSPPKEHGGLSAVTARGVGVHIAHVNKTGGMAALIACSECHVVPATASSPGHNDKKTDVVFGPRTKTVTSSRNAAGGTTTVTPVPVWNGTGTSPALTCSATYCHGHYAAPSHPSGRATTATPAWTAGGTLSCTSCHGVPSDSCHPPRFNHEGGNSCNDCHQDTDAGGTRITNRTLHVNGVVNGKCTDCHRNETKVCVP